VPEEIGHAADLSSVATRAAPKVAMLHVCDIATSIEEAMCFTMLNASFTEVAI
jgi:hypothetical protein